MKDCNSYPEQPTPGQDRVDSAMHEALGTLGPLLDVPADPSADDVARWTAEGARRHGVAPRRTPASPLRRKLTRLCGAAAALALAAGGVYLVFGNGSRAQASTILKALQSSTFSGLHVSFKGVRVSGFEATGEAWARFRDELAAADLLGSDAEAKEASLLEVHSLSLQAHIAGNEDAEMPGLAGDVAVGMTPDQGWAHLQSPTPEVVAERLGPSSQGIAASLPGGVLVLFGGTSSGDGTPALPPGFDPLDGVDLMKPGMVIKSVAADPPPTHAGAASSSTQVLVRMGGAKAGTAGGDLAARLMPLLRGQAGVTQIQQFVQLCSNGGGTCRVTAQPDGSSLLTVRGEPGVGGKSFATTMTIAYREGSGVQWIEFLGVGDSAESTVRIETFSGEIAQDLLVPGSSMNEKALKLDLRGR